MRLACARQVNIAWGSTYPTVQIHRTTSERLHGIAARDAEGRWQWVHSARSTVPVRQLRDYARLTGTPLLFPYSSLRYLLQPLETPEPQRSLQVQPTPQDDLRSQHPRAPDVLRFYKAPLNSDANACTRGTNSSH
jgi:hypothetical protein